MCEPIFACCARQKHVDERTEAERTEAERTEAERTEADPAQRRAGLVRQAPFSRD